MQLSELIDLQRQLDKRHGFETEFADPTEKYAQVTKDVVGLFGEVGEFANLLKKLNLKLDRPAEYELEIAQVESAMAEELADVFIYLIRISSILSVDLEEATRNKIQLNAVRYAALRRP
jgi:NTP pyrophosphatase (non-canonical NTP hydrolase)